MLPLLCCNNHIFTYTRNPPKLAMESRVKSKNDKQSLFEKSMMVVANIIRLSSFSIAQRTLGVSPTGKTGKGLTGSDYSDMEPEKVHNDQFPTTSKRSLKPKSPANPTYVIRPGGSNVIYKGRVDDVTPKKKECTTVDEVAAEYIEKIRSQLEGGELHKRHGN